MPMPALSRAALERLLALSVASAVLLTITIVASTADQQQAAAAWLQNAGAAWAPARLSGGSRRLLQGPHETGLSTRWYERLNVHDGSTAVAKATASRQPVPVPLLLHAGDEAAKKADRDAWVQAHPLCTLFLVSVVSSLQHRLCGGAAVSYKGARDALVHAGQQCGCSMPDGLQRGAKRSVCGAGDAAPAAGGAGGRAVLRGAQRQQDARQRGRHCHSRHAPVPQHGDIM